MKVLRKLPEITIKFRLQIISISFIMLTILILYWQDLSILANEAIQYEAVSYIILVPLLASFLIYRKKELVKASLAMERLRAKTKTISLSEIAGIAVCLSAFLLYWYGSYTFYPLEYHIASLVVFLIGITLTLFNITTLIALIFPILFLLFLMPPPSSVTFSAGATLGNFNSQVSYALLKILGLPVALSSEYGPPTIVLNNRSEYALEFAVDLSCSGIYSLVAFTMFATFIVSIIRGSITKKIALFPLGFTMLTILNILRISLVVSVAYQIGEPIAMIIFHLSSGWLLTFLGIFLLLLITEKLLHLQIFAGRNKIASSHKCEDTLKSNETFCLHCGRILKNYQTSLPTKFWVKIIALLLACYLVTLTIQAPVFAITEKLTITNSDPEASTEAFPQFKDYKLIFWERDRAFEKISRQDASLLYAYMSQNISNPDDVYVLVGVASSYSTLHSWEVCLVTWQTARGYAPLVDVLDSRNIQIMQNPPITAKYFVFKHPENYTQVTLFWYQRALFKTGLTIEPRYTRISLIILTKNPDDYPKLEQKLLGIGESIVAYWEPVKAQSLVSLGIPTMQVLLGSTILFAAIVQTTQYTEEWRRKTTKLKIFEKLASKKEKLLYRTIKELSQNAKETTTQNIASAFEKATGKAVKLDEIISMLNNLKGHGIIKLDITKTLDQPRLIWKP